MLFPSSFDYCMRLAIKAGLSFVDEAACAMCDHAQALIDEGMQPSDEALLEYVKVRYHGRHE